MVNNSTKYAPLDGGDDNNNNVQQQQEQHYHHHSHNVAREQGLVGNDVVIVKDVHAVAISGHSHHNNNNNNNHHHGGNNNNNNGGVTRKQRLWLIALGCFGLGVLFASTVLIYAPTAPALQTPSPTPASFLRPTTKDEDSHKTRKHTTDETQDEESSQEEESTSQEDESTTSLEGESSQEDEEDEEASQEEYRSNSISNDHDDKAEHADGIFFTPVGLNQTIQHMDIDKDGTAKHGDDWWSKTKNGVSHLFSNKDDKNKNVLLLAGGGRDWLLDAQTGRIIAKHDTSLFLGMGPARLVLVPRNSPNRLQFTPSSSNDVIMNNKNKKKKSTISLTLTDKRGYNVAAVPPNSNGDDDNDADDKKNPAALRAIVSRFIKPMTVQYVNQTYLQYQNACLDVLRWNMISHQPLQFVFPPPPPPSSSSEEEGEKESNTSSTITGNTKKDEENSCFIPGGGRNFDWNSKDGTLSPSLNKDLVLGMDVSSLVITSNPLEALYIQHGHELANDDVGGPFVVTLTTTKKELYKIVLQHPTMEDEDDKKQKKTTTTTLERVDAVIVPIDQQPQKEAAQVYYFHGNFILTKDNQHVLAIDDVQQAKNGMQVYFVGKHK